MLFVSYATRDLGQVKQLVAAIEARGLRCWFAARDIAPSAIFAKAIADAVRASSGCVVVVSKASLASDGVLRELELASSSDKPFFPILIEPCKLTPGFDYYLSVAQWIDYAKEGEAGLDRLVEVDTGPMPPPRRRGWLEGRLTPQRIGLAFVGLVAAGAVLAMTYRQEPDPIAPPDYLAMRSEVVDAVRRLDAERMRELIKRGWSPNWALDSSNGHTLHLLAETCEWNPGADPQQVVQFGRMLIDNGAQLTTANTFDDTPLDIARAKRFCGPDHALTNLYTKLCTSKDGLMPDCT